MLIYVMLGMTSSPRRIMGRKRKPSLEVEYAQEREIKDLKQQIENLKKQLRELQKTDKVKPEKLKPIKPVDKPCPKCGASLKESEIPSVGTLELCSAACGHRLVRKGK
jgi:DNA repair exonuclease SbcCD ATPase subunit